MAETPVSTMPDFKYQWDLQASDIFEVTILRSLEGIEQRQIETRLGGYERFSGTTTLLGQKDRQQLVQFVRDMNGNAFPFYWFRGDQANYYNYAVKTLVAETTVSIPFRDWNATQDETPALWTALVAGVSKAFTVSRQTGAQGQDQLVFSAGAQTGAMVITGSGRRLKVGRFNFSSNEAIQQFVKNATKLKTSIQIPLIELESTV